MAAKGKGGAKVTIVADKINSPRALARELLGDTRTKAQVDKLTAKIIEKNDFVKGQDLFADDIVIVGKKTTKALGTLEKSTVPNYVFGNKTVQTVSPTPSMPYTPPSRPDIPASMASVKIATPDIILFDEEGIEIEIMTDLIFENIGGQEIISISRNDIINGQQVSYSPIKNLSKINLQYNAQNILPLENTSKNYFDNFAIKLEDKLPELGTGPSGEIVYLDSATGDLVINTVSMEPGEQVEVEIFQAGDVLNDTIYGDINYGEES
jgi:hypothetical protein